MPNSMPGQFYDKDLGIATRQHETELEWPEVVR